EVGVGDPITLEGVGKGLRYGFLTDQVRKLLWPAAPRQHGIVLPVGVRRRHAGGFWIFDCRTSLNRHASIKNRPVKKGARGGFPREADPLLKGSLLMAAPSGLTRFTTSLCVGPLPAPYHGHQCLHELLGDYTRSRPAQEVCGNGSEGLCYGA